MKKFSIKHDIFQKKFEEIENFFRFSKKKFLNLNNNLSIAIETGLSKVFLKMLLSPIERSKIETLKALDIVLSDFIVVMLVKKAFSRVVYVNLTPKSVSTNCTKCTRVVVLLTFCEKAVSRHTVLY